MPKELTWENFAIALAGYCYRETGRKILVKEELMKELKEKDYYDKLSDFIR